MPVNGLSRDGVGGERDVSGVEEVCLDVGDAGVVGVEEGEFDAGSAREFCEDRDSV